MNIYTVIDLETTGLDYKNDRIIEIAAKRVSLPEGRGLGTFQTLVQQDVVVSKFITRLTGIRQHDIQYPFAMDKMTALHTLKQLCDNAVVVAQHAPFDLSFLYPYINPQQFVCTRTLSKIIESEQSASLGPTCERHGIEHVNAHNAMDDVEATWELFKIRYEQMNNRKEGFLNKVINSKERPLNFIPDHAHVINFS